MSLPLGFRELGLVDYQPTWHAMQRFTDTRGVDTPDEIWLLEHTPVFTQGQAGKAEHVLFPGDIPVVQACSLIFASTYILLNTTADVLSIASNPRLMHPKG